MSAVDGQENSQPSKAERGKIAQRLYRKRHASKFQTLQDENKKLRDAIHAIVRAASRSRGLGDELESVLEEARTVAGLEKVKRIQDVSGVDNPVANCLSCSQAQNRTRTLLSPSRSSSNERVGGPGLTQSGSFKPLMAKSLWLDTDRLVRLFDAPADLAPYLGDGMFTLAGCLYWACVRQFVAIWQEMTASDTQREAGTTYLDRLFNHSKELTDAPFLVSLGQARLDYKRQGFIECSISQASASSDSVVVDLLKRVKEEYAGRGESLSWWKTPQQVESYVKQHIGTEVYAKLLSVIKGEGSEEEATRFGPLVESLAQNYVCFGNGPRWNAIYVSICVGAWAKQHLAGRLFELEPKQRLRPTQGLTNAVLQNIPIFKDSSIMSAVAVQAPVPVGPVGQPDIAYTPNHDTYLARVKRRQETEQLQKSLPTGFPTKLHSDLVWDGKDLAKTYDWNYVLTDADLEEVAAALQHFRSLNVPLGELNQETFPLPKLHDTLRGISRELHFGHGLKVIRGVPVDKYTREENIIIYAGISSHVGPVRGRQDHQYQGKPADVVLAHIKDLTGEVDAHRIGAPAYTTEKQVFHTDSGDIIALFALGEAAEGGQSYLSSSWHVYNILAATRPDIIHTLAEPWTSDQFGRGGKKFTTRPLLYHQPAEGDIPERLIIQYARRQFTGYWGLPRSADIPPITEAQAEALDTLHFLAEKHAVSLDFHKGDIQYANNLSIFHARAGFKDSAEKQRHLTRLWLRDPELAWKTPEALKDRWDNVYDGVTAEKSVFPLEPSIRSASDALAVNEAKAGGGE
ncbi:hypothetical protein G7046_g958 [Stylonectria norvegica]|nr:hypothetical protein G7046_g958 [Stylonectria norvegica]